MTFDEAIKQFKYDAECNRAGFDLSSAQDNEQLAEWLEDYKRIKEEIGTDWLKEHDRLIRNKAIDDFADKLRQDKMIITFGLRICDVDRIAEHLKEGEIE